MEGRGDQKGSSSDQRREVVEGRVFEDEGDVERGEGVVQQVEEDELAGGVESVALGAGHRFLLGLVPCVAEALRTRSTSERRRRALLWTRRATPK